MKFRMNNRKTLPLLTALLMPLAPLSGYAASPLDDAIDYKQVSAPALQTLIHSASLADRITGIKALSRILTKESCETLVQLFQSPVNSGAADSEIFKAMGEHAIDPSFTTPECAAKIKSTLEDTLVSVQDLSLPMDEGAESNLIEALGKWSFADPHSYFLAAIQKANLSEVLKKAITKGWMQSRISRLLHLPNAPVLAPSAELVAMLEKEINSAQSLALKKELFFAAAQWKVALSREIVLANLVASKDRDFTLFIFKQLLRFPIANLKDALIPFLASDDGIYRLSAYQALAKSMDADGDLLRSSLEKESLPAIRAMMLTAYVASPVFTKTAAELQAIIASTEIRSDLGWTRSVAYTALFPLLTDVAAKKAAIQKALDDSNVQVQLAASAALADLKDSAFSLQTVQAHIRNAHPLLVASFADLLRASDSRNDSAYSTLESLTTSTSVAIRGTAVASLWTFSDRATFKSLILAILENSKTQIWVDLRTDLVKAISEKMKDISGTELLEKIRAEDSSTVVSNLARQALLDRGVTALPDAKEEVFPLSPYRNDEIKGTSPHVLLKTTRGDLEIELYPNIAPMHVRAFLGLVNSGFYNGMEFYRVEPDFVLQGGDQEGTGWGDPGFNLRAENSDTPYVRGSLGMARATPFDTGSSHVFITLTATPSLENLYTNFGKVVRGIELLEKVELQDKVITATEL